MNFYSKVLNLPLNRHTDTFAELSCPTSGVKLTLMATESEAKLSSGYGPFIQFSVPDMDTAVSTAAQLGANLDGPVKFPAHGKTAVLRSPDNHMIGLYEPTDSFENISGSG